MDNFAARSALVAVWITIGAIGLMLLGTGAAQVFGGFFIKNEVGDFMNMGNAMFMTAIPLILVGLTITGFCIRRIWHDLRRPMAPGKDARAETPFLRLLAIAAFAAGTVFGGYGLYKRGMPMLDDIKEIVALETTRAKVITIDRVEGEREEKSGTFAYYVDGDFNQRHEGIYENKFPNQVLKPGRTFSVTYLRSDPAQYFLDRRKPSIGYLLPQLLGQIIIFWMVAAGITGIKANLGDEEDDDDYYDDYEPEYNPYQAQANTSIRTGNSGGFGKFRGIK